MPSSGPPNDEEIARRRDEALRRALNTPPQPKHRKVTESTKPRKRPIDRTVLPSESVGMDKGKAESKN